MEYKGNTSDYNCGASPRSGTAITKDEYILVFTVTFCYRLESDSGAQRMGIEECGELPVFIDIIGLVSDRSPKSHQIFLTEKRIGNNIERDLPLPQSLADKNVERCRQIHAHGGKGCVSLLFQSPIHSDANPLMSLAASPAEAPSRTAKRTSTP
ncbi:MAG: hypothetical protein FWG15_01895 [Propionibacteriaceae bacterium]|nr:hypothetical protein [Propionibacteriaceae bacterium]